MYFSPIRDVTSHHLCQTEVSKMSQILSAQREITKRDGNHWKSLSVLLSYLQPSFKVTENVKGKS